MFRDIQIRKEIGVLSLVLVAVTLTGCTNSQGCYRGAESAETAVSQLLEASWNNDPVGACQVATSDVSSAELDKNMDYIRLVIGEAGGIENVAVREDVKAQMGVNLWVDMLISDSATTYSFTVTYDGGRYFVSTMTDEVPESADTGKTTSPEQ